jgi:pimeloyl-ACP methyl ester carboxylesterase
MSTNEPRNVAGQDVTWPVDDTTVDGTLVVPAGRGPHPGLVLVAGSGPTDRDWNSPLLAGQNGSGRLLAEALADDGFVTMRYDKRASGPRVRENMSRLIGKISFESHWAELAGAVETLAARPDVDRRRIFALTNSEGALHALYYQMRAPAIPFAGLALTAPPGRAIGAVGRSQIVAQLSGLPDGARYIRLYDEAIGRFSAGEPVEPEPELPEMVQMLLRSLATPANLPFARELWSADAATWLAQVSTPALIVIGKKDIQVDWQADGGPLEQAAAGRTNTRFVYPPNANHVLKHEDRPRAELTAAAAMERYNGPDTILDADAEAAVRSWLLAQAHLA